MLACTQGMGFQTACAIRLHVVGKHRVKQQGHVPKQVMKDIGLDDVVKLFGCANPVGDRKFLVGQQGKKCHLRNQPRYRHHLPACGLVKAIIDFFKARNPGFQTQCW